MAKTQKIEISKATYDTLIEETRAGGITVEDWIRSYLPANSQAEESEGAIGERLERNGLIGIIDSSQPEDPASPPYRPPIYYLIVEKLRKPGANERSRGWWQIANFRFKISRRNYRPVSETALRMESLWEKV
jgi:hypothetical protein